MLDQVAIFTPQGQLLFAHNVLGKRFSEKQVNNFISELLTRTVREKEATYAVISTDSYTYVFQELRSPPLFVAASYSALNSLELNKEAEEAITLALKLWNSLGLNDRILRNSKEGIGMTNQPSWILDGAEEELATFKKYFIAKYETIKERSGTPSGKGEGVNTNHGQKKKTSSRKVQKQFAGKSRKWVNGMLVDEHDSSDGAALDFSPDTASSAVAEESTHLAGVNKSSFGTMEANGDFLIKEIDEFLNDSAPSSAVSAPKSRTNPFGFLKKHLLGNKVITKDDLKDVLDKLKKQLIAKNVAPSVADYLASQVSVDLLGTKTENWTSVQNTARTSLEKVLTNLLTPSVSVDLLHEIQKKTTRKSPSEKKAPYVFSVVGVNGVGKSTNLSKLAFWLLQNRFKVLIVACDTFRSGAVEQLRTHVENLAQLTDENHVRGSKNARNKTGNEFIELFEAGYGGTDLVTKIAKQAISYAHENYFDVVLMDTAGRRHNDATLMSPLKSFAEKANPDKIIMVGEALVGTDSVEQARNFNQAFGKERNLDFYIISKCDTVGELLGTMVNMVYATGIPILFIGVGQTYTDLRTLSVKWAVHTLLS